MAFVLIFIGEQKVGMFENPGRPVMEQIKWDTIDKGHIGFVTGTMPGILVENVNLTKRRKFSYLQEKE